jgi:hemolysin activation/secretion protein
MRSKPPRLSANHLGALAACGLLLGGNSWAQTAPDAGSVLRDQQRAVPELPRPAPALRVDEPARAALDGSSLTRFMLRSVKVSGSSVYGAAELQALLQDAIGTEVDFVALDALAARISRHYRERGYLVARAYLPAQEIRDGAIEIAVIEGRLGRVAVNNASRVNERVVAAHTGALPGSVVQARTLERAILLLNDLPGVGEARAGLSAGANVGESDLTLNLTAAPAWRASVELDNHGNRYTGAARVTGRFSLNSPMGWGDALQGVITRGFSGLAYGRLAYQAPVGGQGLALGLAFSHVNYSLGKDFESLDKHGTADTWSATASYPFVRGSQANLSAQLALDRSALDDREGATRTGTDKSTQAATLTLQGDLRDGWMGGGVSVFALGFGAGRLAIDTPAARAIDDAAGRTRGRYGRWNLSLLRQQVLGGAWSAQLALSAQQADKNLDSSEKFSLGGAQGVRAYPQGEASGDSGWLARAEVRHATRLGGLPGNLEHFAFVDAGAVRINENAYGSTDNHRKLAGAGLGLAWSQPANWQVRLAVATRLGGERATSAGTDRRTRGWIHFTKFL